MARRPVGAAPRTPFALPGLAIDSVERVRLIAMLDAAVDQRLTAVVAPAGFGKTVALCQWARARRGRRVRWLTLGAAHNDARRLRLDCERAIEDHPETVLVLDGLHLVVEAAAHDSLTALIAESPEAMRIVIASRIALPDQHYRFGLEGRLREIRKADLVVTQSEAAELVRHVAHRMVTDGQVATLVARTGAWPAGLAMAARALRDAEAASDGDVAAFVEWFAGDAPAVAAYFRSELVEALSPAEHRFLLSASVLDRLNGELCDHVTGSTGSDALLASLERRSLFVSSVDADHQWYRQNALCRSFLRHELAAENADAPRALLRRAAEWHLARGEPAIATDYLAEAEEWDALLDIAWERGGLVLGRPSACEVLRWMSRVPKAVLRRRVSMDLLEATTALFDDDAKRAREILGRIGDADVTSGDRLVADVVGSYVAFVDGSSGGGFAAIDDVVRRAASVPEAELPNLLGLTGSRVDVCAAAHATRGLALMHDDRVEDALSDFNAVPDSAHSVWRAFALASHALLDAWAGRLADAEHFASRSIAVAGQTQVPEPLVLLAWIARSVVARQRDELDEASHAIDQARRSASQTLPAVAVWVALEDALLAVARGDAPRALTAVAAARFVIERRTISAALASRVDATEARALLLVGDDAGAARVLASAPVPDHADVIAVQVRQSVERDDLAAARRLLLRWEADFGTRGPLERQLWSATVGCLEGDESQARAGLLTVVARAELERNVGLFRDAGPSVVGPARALERVVTSDFLRNVTARPVATRRPKGSDHHAGSLTDREFDVLDLLPTRCSYDEIAARLGVSRNTVKTHLKHIYWKLNVSGRGEAIGVAAQMRLI